jgi:hypothetical protein
MADETDTDWLRLLDWVDLQPEHQPVPWRAAAPRTPPPTQPNPLVNGNMQTIVTSSPTATSRIDSKLIGTNTNPLVTKPPAVPSTSETLVVAIDPGLPTATRKVNAVVSVPIGGVAPFTIMSCPVAGTQIKAIALSIFDPAATPGAAHIEVLIDVAGQPTNVLYRGAVGTDSPIVLAFDGGVFSSVNVQLSVPARAGSAQTVSLYYNVYGRDV